MSTYLQVLCLIGFGTVYFGACWCLAWVLERAFRGRRLRKQQQWAEEFSLEVKEERREQ